MKHKAQQLQAGSTTMLCIGVILPLILFLLAASLEISAFLQARESVAQNLDVTARLALRNRLSVSGTEGAVRVALKPLSPLVQVTGISAASTARMRSIDLVAEYKPQLAALLTDLIGGNRGAIPFSLRTKVQRIPSEATIIFDRYIPIGSDGCGDPVFTAIREFVTQLATALSQIGVEKIILGAIPGGAANEVAQISIDGRVDGLQRCGGTSIPIGVRESITTLRGTSRTRGPMWEIVSGLSELFLAEGRSPTTRKQLFYLITREGVVSWDDLSQSVTALNNIAISGKLRVSLRRVVVDTTTAPIGSAGGWERAVSADSGVDSRIFYISDPKGLGRPFVTALVGTDDVVVLAE